MRVWNCKCTSLVKWLLFQATMLFDVKAQSQGNLFEYLLLSRIGGHTQIPVKAAAVQWSVVVSGYTNNPLNGWNGVYTPVHDLIWVTCESVCGWVYKWIKKRWLLFGLLSLCSLGDRNKNFSPAAVLIKSSPILQHCTVVLYSWQNQCHCDEVRDGVELKETICTQLQLDDVFLWQTLRFFKYNVRRMLNANIFNEINSCLMSNILYFFPCPW